MTSSSFSSVLQKINFFVKFFRLTCPFTSFFYPIGFAFENNQFFFSELCKKWPVNCFNCLLDKKFFENRTEILKHCLRLSLITHVCWVFCFFREKWVLKKLNERLRVPCKQQRNKCNKIFAYLLRTRQMLFKRSLRQVLEIRPRLLQLRQLKIWFVGPSKSDAEVNEKWMLHRSCFVSCCLNNKRS